MQEGTERAKQAGTEEDSLGGERVRWAVRVTRCPADANGRAEPSRKALSRPPS